ncbi:MAG TPA: hypothetical protein VIZ22_07540 [Candidatus Limnocylindrales bacterium]
MATKATDATTTRKEQIVDDRAQPGPEMGRKYPEPGPEQGWRFPEPGPDQGRRLPEPGPERGVYRGR